jgi:uncharacterized repeat protein (TIGR03806 family)
MMKLRQGDGEFELKPPTDADGGVKGLDALLDKGDAGAARGRTRAWAPELLSDTGCFSDVPKMQVAPGIFRYEMNSPLWTDGAIKERYISVPPNTQIKILETDLWEFPVGSVLIKNFSVEFEEGNPASKRPVETRLGLRGEDRWHFYSYRWDDDAQEARLLDATEWEITPMKVATKSGSATIRYLYPNESSCAACHNSNLGVVGPRTSQLNKEINYDGTLMNQLDAMDKLGVFDSPLRAAPSELPSVADPTDESRTLEERARSYLDANCSHCHRPGGWVPKELDIDMRWETPLEKAQLCDVKARYGNIFIPTLRVARGNARESMIWKRMQDLGLSRMPMLGTLSLDPGAEVVSDWINSLEDCTDHR